MKKNLKIIQINGIRGLITVGFIGICLIAGFVVFPGYVSMHIWNAVALNIISIPTLGLIQGILLWGIIATVYFIAKKRRFIISFKAPENLSEEELMDVVEKIRINEHTDIISQAMQKSREFENVIKSEKSESELKNGEEISHTVSEDENPEIKL